MEIEDTPHTGDERATLLGFLEWQRATLERKCAGLGPDQLRLRSVEPSSLSLLGLVRHMAGHIGLVPVTTDTVSMPATGMAIAAAANTTITGIGNMIVIIVNMSIAS